MITLQDLFTAKLEFSSLLQPNKQLHAMLHFPESISPYYPTVQRFRFFLFSVSSFCHVPLLRPLLYIICDNVCYPGLLSIVLSRNTWFHFEEMTRIRLSCPPNRQQAMNIFVLFKKNLTIFLRLQIPNYQVTYSIWWMVKMLQMATWFSY